MFDTYDNMLEKSKPKPEPETVCCARSGSGSEKPCQQRTVPAVYRKLGSCGWYWCMSSCTGSDETIQLLVFCPVPVVTLVDESIGTIGKSIAYFLLFE